MECVVCSLLVYYTICRVDTILMFNKAGPQLPIANVIPYIAYIFVCYICASASASVSNILPVCTPNAHIDYKEELVRYRPEPFSSNVFYSIFVIFSWSNGTQHQPQQHYKSV